MPKEKKLAKSTRRFIRKEKARIRREFLDIRRQKELIEGLYNRHQNQQAEPSAPKALNEEAKERKNKKSKKDKK